MSAKVSIASVTAALAVMACGVWISGQKLPSEPPHEAATSITGAFEGWFPNADGTFSLLLGYNNRNLKQELDIPIGPNNHIDPSGPDRGQPTHFLTGRQWGLFVVKVPKDFGKNKISWTIVANGQTTVIPASLHRDYQVSPFMSTASAVGPGTARSGHRADCERVGAVAAHRLGCRRCEDLHELRGDSERAEAAAGDAQVEQVPGGGPRDLRQGQAADREGR